MSERDMLERAGWYRYSAKRMGCIVQVLWADRKTGEVMSQYVAVQTQRMRNRASKEIEARKVDMQ